MSITPLNSSDTFKTWFDTTNTIIGEVNGITIHNLIPGDGISLTSNGNNVYTIKHGSVVATPVTFTGPVSFTNTVSFANAPSVNSVTVSVSPKSAGITIGNIVRIDSAGLTLSKADSASNAEVLGIVINSDATSHTVATSGVVNNTLFASTIGNLLGIVGGTLSAGCAYFLSPTVAGGITSIEPTTYQHVSKPIILGVTGSAGSILPYRGIQVEGISAGITAELDNKVIVEIDYSGNWSANRTFQSLVGAWPYNGTPYNALADNPLCIGDPVYMLTAPGIFDTSENAEMIIDVFHCKVFGKMNGSSSSLLAIFLATPDGWGQSGGYYQQKRLYGLISKILSTDLVNKKIILEITRPGGSFTTTYDNLKNKGNAARLTQPNFEFYNDTILKGGDFFLAGQCDDGSTSGFFPNHTWCAGQAMLAPAYDGIHYITVTPYNDVNQTLNVYLDPRAPNHKYVTVSSKTDAAALGACAITSITDFSITDFTQTLGGALTSSFTNSVGVNYASGLTGALEYDNLLPNGSFTIWQRPFSNLSGVTHAGLSGFNTPIADRWFYMKSSVTNNPGLTVNIQKQTFDASDTTIPGSPYYWVDVKQTYTSAAGLNYRPRLENIQRGARLLQGQQATVSFWALASTSGTTLDLVYNRYRDGAYGTITDIEDELAGRETIATGITLSSVWSQYSYAFTTSSQGVVSNDEQGWYGLGFEFPSAGVTLSIAQVKLELGTDTADYIYSRPEQELERCSPYYLRTYDWDQTTGYTGSSKLNEQHLALGNLQSQKTYTIKFPVETVQTPHSVTLYSSTGMVDEAFNVTKNTDMRYPTCETCPIHVNLPWDTSTIRTSLPSGNITVSDKSVNGMQVTINNGATHLDTLKFHYVADADIKLTT